jgi:hypothetical protein
MPEPEKKTEDKTDDDAPKYLTEEDFGKLFNGAFTAKWRTLEKQLQTSQEKSTTDLLAKLDEKFAALKPAKSDDQTDKTKPAPESDAVQKQLKELAEKLELATAKAAEADRARAEVERQRVYDGAKASLTSALKEKAHADYLDDWIRAVEPKLTVADDGTVTLKVKHSPFKGSPEVEEDLPLDQAVPKLIERAEYKKYQAAPAVPDGKGSRGPRTTAANGKTSLNSDNPLDRVRARLADIGVNFDEEFGG